MNSEIFSEIPATWQFQLGWRFDIHVSWRGRRTRIDVKHDQMQIMKDDENLSLNTEQCGLRR